MSRAMIDPHTASAVIDLDALQANVAAISRLVAPAEMMMVVKADAYGHGMPACARVGRAAGVRWLGVATPGEALALRADGDVGRIFCWLYGPDDELAGLVAEGIDISVQTPEQINAVVAAASTAERTARIHLKIDTGLSRNGCTPARWPELVAAAAEAVATGAVETVGVWSHFACADEPGHPGNRAQLEVFSWAYDRAGEGGLTIPIRHIANTPAALTMPEARFELVRIGIGCYGIDPADATLAADAGVDLAPVMTVRARLVHRKEVPAGTGVSYGFHWRAADDTVLGLVPLGYADGMDRHGAGRYQLLVGGRRVPQRGSVCMDQMIVELGPGATDAVGDEVVLFGASPAPSASEWAHWAGTIGYEVVTRIGTRVPRIYRGGPPER